MSELRKQNINRNELGFDAWGRNKVVNDKSLLHGIFTFDVPIDFWKQQINEVEQLAFDSSISSINGELNVQSSVTLNERINLSSFRSPRYQPNRGQLYSVSIFLPNKAALGSRKFGLFTSESGNYFELDNGVLYAVTRTTKSGLTTEDKEVINLTGSNIDLEKGNTFDIQMQWRGVGNIRYFINQTFMHEKILLGQLDNLSSFNPTAPLSYESVNQGDQVTIVSGCVDVTSEGGTKEGGVYGSVSISNNSGQVAINGFNIPIIAIRSKLTKNGFINTQDTLALLASAYGDQRCVFRVWATRDFTAITENDQVWVDFRVGHLEYIEYNLPPVATPMTFDTTKATLIFSARVDQDQTYATSALFEGRTDIYLTHGDMFIFTMHRETGAAANVGVTFEFSEEA